MNFPMRNDKKYTYVDYLAWSDNERWELIQGIAYNMTPAPSRKHQEVLNAINNAFYNYLKGKPCSVYISPFDVRLSDSENDHECENVVQPDITVICDMSKLDDKGCKGTPDLIVEVLSPGTAKIDLFYKLNLYEKFKVNEYWIVDPINQYISVYILDVNERYGKPHSYSREDILKVGILDLEIDLREVFSDIL